MHAAGVQHGGAGVPQWSLMPAASKLRACILSVAACSLYEEFVGDAPYLLRLEEVSHLYGLPLMLTTGTYQAPGPHKLACVVRQMLTSLIGTILY
jgi:hypothetical protein